MNIEDVQKYCLSMPYASEDVKWGKDLCFCVAGKMFAVVGLEPEKVVGSFKCTPEKFAELIERPGIIPAPYVARYHWVGLESLDIFPDEEFRELLTKSYQMVYEKLPKKTKEGLRSEV